MPLAEYAYSLSLFIFSNLGSYWDLVATATGASMRSGLNM